MNVKKAVSGGVPGTTAMTRVDEFITNSKVGFVLVKLSVPGACAPYHCSSILNQDRTHVDFKVNKKTSSQTGVIEFFSMQARVYVRRAWGSRATTLY